MDLDLIRHRLDQIEERLASHRNDPPLASLVSALRDEIPSDACTETRYLADGRLTEPDSLIGNDWRPYDAAGKDEDVARQIYEGRITARNLGHGDAAFRKTLFRLVKRISVIRNEVIETE
jgi:hypothetical protein